MVYAVHTLNATLWFVFGMSLKVWGTRPSDGDIGLLFMLFGFFGKVISWYLWAQDKKTT
jgi:hypothetical protein